MLNSGVQLCDGGIHILAQLGNFIFTVTTALLCALCSIDVVA
ncbi:Uncharacterised protein [Vibrio cholerae]|nr:Uncharacterised protein [Vibrio cholerae]